MPNEVQKFFDGLKEEQLDNQPVDFFEAEAPVTPAGEAEIPATKDDDEPRKNRRHRRLEEKLEAERQFNIEQARLLKEKDDELQRLRSGGSAQTPTGEMPPEWIELYGNTPEAKRAWEINQKTLISFRDQAKREAKEEALAEFERKQKGEQDARRQVEDYVDTQLETLEDLHNIDLTSDAPTAKKARKEFLETVQKLSPKDASGNITGYADFGAAFEMYQLGKSQQNAETNRSKELGSRTMQKSGPSTPSQKRPTSGFRGWMKDYNLQ